MFVSVMDQTGMNIIIPSIADAFDAPIPTVQWVVLGYILAISSVMLPLGRLAARITWTQDGLRLEEATLSGPAADLSFHGAWPGAGGGMAAGTAPLTMEAELERIDLSVLGRLAGQANLATGELHGAGELTWSEGAPRVRVALSGERLLVAGHPLDGMRLQAVMDDRALHVTLDWWWRR